MLWSCSRYTATSWFFIRFNPSRVRIQMLPSLAASTATMRTLDNPSRREYVVTGVSRNRSSPLKLPTQMLPSRSSNIAVISSPESPSVRVNISVLP